jgi:hypothetical protein
VAKHCCRQFPREVLGRIKKEEDELRQELISGNLVPPDSWVDSAFHREYAEERLRELEPVHALIREWCGQEASEDFDRVLALREEVDRPRKLVQETALWLKHNGYPVKAGLLCKELSQITEADENPSLVGDCSPKGLIGAASHTDTLCLPRNGSESESR